MGTDHELYVKELRVPTLEDIQKKLEWWKEFRRLIEEEERSDPKIRMNQLKRVVKKYAENLQKCGAKVSSDNLWDCFVEDIGGEYYGGFIIQHWESGIMLCINLPSIIMLSDKALKYFKKEEIGNVQKTNRKNSGNFRR